MVMVIKMDLILEIIMETLMEKKPVTIMEMWMDIIMVKIISMKIGAI
jgi:hypothetical protein